MNKYLQILKDNISCSVTAFHTVNKVVERLTENDFQEISIDKPFTIKSGGRYFAKIYDSSLMAFVIGENGIIDSFGPSIRVAGCHTDFPCFKIKPQPQLETGDSGRKYIKLNTQVYGGPILNTWLDRPLSIAGRVVIKGDNIFYPQSLLVDFDRPVLTIPNLPIHLNREVNKGIELNKQKDMLPICDAISMELSNNLFMEKLLEAVNEILLKKNQPAVSQEEILDFDLFVYQYEEGCEIGFNNSMYSSPRLDNITSVTGICNGLIEARRKEGINISLFYDNEEIGSNTKQGAASNIIVYLLEKIFSEFNLSRNKFLEEVAKGLLLSVDVAHGNHPNSPEKYDITNNVILNGGIVIKKSANQAYSCDGISAGIVKELCRKYQISFQEYVNRSDIPGGQTLGGIISTVLPIRTQDIGVPILAMHSARELMGAEDQKSLEKLLTGFYS